MVSYQPDPVPAAFRRPRGRPSFIGLEDRQVLAIAEHALLAVAALPLDSRDRVRQWERFDNAMAELAARGTRYMLAKIRERERGEGTPAS